MNTRNIKVYSALIAAMIFWSISFIWTKGLLETFAPITLIVIRLLISTIFLYLLGVGSRNFKTFSKKDRPRILLMALFNPFLYFIGENFGMQYVSPTLASVLIATIPLFTPIAAFIILKERLSRSNYIGIAVSVIGVFLVIVKPSLEIDAEPLGILFLLLAVIAAVFYSLSLRKLAGTYNALNLTVYQNAFGLLFFLPLLLGFEGQELKQIDWNWELLPPLLGLSILCSSLAFMFFAYGIQHLGVSKSNVFSNVIPIFTALFSFLFFDELLSIYQLLGIGFVIIGLFLSQIRKRKVVPTS